MTPPRDTGGDPLGDPRGDSVLRIAGLAKRFVLHERGAVIDALSAFDAVVRAGRMTALVGPSGSGKSSVLRCVHRTYLASAGRIDYTAADGRVVDLVSADEPTILALRRREIRMVSQFLRILPRQPAARVAGRPLVELGVEPEEAVDRGRALLNQLGLPARLHDVPPATFSGGERQLVNLAQALIVAPRLLLLDEPTASLDPRSADQVAAAIETLKGRDVAVLAVFHDRAMVDRLADDVVALTGGVDAAYREPAEATA